MYKFHQVNLKDKQERDFYSEKLHSFEKQFTYPLGNTFFHIQHGVDYFSFFEQMGIPYYFVAILDGEVVGAACAVLRESNLKKYWYLCDVKILKEHRGRKIIEKMTLKYFFKCIIKSRRFVAINMEGNCKNGLVKKIKKLFPCFSLHFKHIYFYEYNSNNFPHSLNNCFIYTNQNKKDIILPSGAWRLYHVSHTYNSLATQIELASLSFNDTILYASETEDPHVVARALVISSGINLDHVSSLDI